MEGSGAAPMRGVRKATPKGQMSGSGMGPAITHLPYHLKMLFEPNPPLEYIAPTVKRKMPPYTGLNGLADHFETTEPPVRHVQETPLERRARLCKEKADAHAVELEARKAQWNPETDKVELKTDDAYKTLFVGRISYETTEKQLRREFERYGEIHKIRLVEDEEGKSRGYAFIEFQDEGAMKAAYKNADGKKIDGRRIVVDVERGRTVRDWKPRKLGGGIGGTRLGGAAVNLKYSGREVIRSSGPTSSYHSNAPPPMRRDDRPRSRSRGRDPQLSRYGGPPPPMDRRPMDRRSRSRSRSRDRRRRPPSRSRSRSRPRGYRR